MNICIIPARAGSKRIPGKNIKPFLGVPIIRYPLETALQFGFDRIIISTDSVDIAAMCPEAEYFERNDTYAGDHVELEDVIYEVLEKTNVKGTCCVLLPTAVFTTPEYLTFYDKKGFYYAVTEFGYPVQRAVGPVHQGKYSFCLIHGSRYADKRSQDLAPMYHDAGQFYYFRINKFKHYWSQKIRLLEIPSEVLVMPRHEVQDIDVLEDWEMAEMKYQKMQEANTL